MKSMGRAVAHPESGQALAQPEVQALIVEVVWPASHYQRRFIRAVTSHNAHSAAMKGFNELLLFFHGMAQRIAHLGLADLQPTPHLLVDVERQELGVRFSTSSSELRTDCAPIPKAARIMKVLLCTIGQ